MKKLLAIIVVSLLLSANSYSAERITGKLVFVDQITNDFLKNKTITDLEKLGFLYKTERITTTEESVQYYLVKQMSDGYVRVICFVDPKKTICRLP